MNPAKDNFSATLHQKIAEYDMLSLKAKVASLYLFDMGNVVIKNIHVLPEIIVHYKLPEDEFRTDYQNYDFAMMDGAISTGDYWRHIEAKFGVQVQGDPFKDYFKPVINQSMAAIIERLRKQGKRVVAASNTFAPHYEPLVEQGFTGLFDYFYASHLMQVSKPSRLFFEYILKAENSKPENSFFVDDYRTNVDAAQKLGIPSLWYADDEIACADEKLERVFG